MTIPDPKFDSLTYATLVREARARIPVHTPEWTNLNDSDPGVTLLQLFAFMSESVIYRANRIPERNRQKFLRLLGIPIRPPAAAEGLVAFSNPRGPATPIILPPACELKAGAVSFRTETGLDVLPIESRLYIKRPVPDRSQPEVEALYRQLYASFDEPGQTLAFYETEAVEPPAPGDEARAFNLAADTIDGAAWLALLTRPGDDPAALRTQLAGRVLTLGIAPATASRGHVLKAGEGLAADGSTDVPLLAFDIPVTTDTTARYAALQTVGSDNLLARPGLVELKLPDAAGLAYTWTDTLEPLEAGAGALPPSLSETEDEPRLITWIRIRPSGGESASAGRQSQVALQWVGINASRVMQRSVVPAERLPAGTGEPDQVAVLARTPVLPETLQVAVNGALWQRIDDLAAAPGEGSGDAPPEAALVCALDPATGTISFGDGLHGARPPLGAVIQAAYACGGGLEGQVGIGAISAGPPLPAALKVTNPIPTYGAARGETVAEAEKRIPGSFRRRNRVVSQSDFEEVARETPGVDLGRVEAIPLLHPDQPEQPAPGAVTVMVVPRLDASGADAPSPDRLVLDRVCRYLAPRRLVTTELHVRGPDYRDLWVSVGLEVIEGMSQAPVLRDARVAIRRFLSPLTGGFDRQGWPLQRAVDLAEIGAEATRVPGVAKVTGLLMAGPDGESTTVVEMSGLQLPRLPGLAVGVGPALSLDSLLGQAVEAAGETRLLPVPIIPRKC